MYTRERNTPKFKHPRWVKGRPHGAGRALGYEQQCPNQAGADAEAHIPRECPAPASVIGGLESGEDRGSGGRPGGAAHLEEKAGSVLSHHLQNPPPTKVTTWAKAIRTQSSDVFEKLRHPGSCPAHAPLKACQRRLSILLLFSPWTMSPSSSGQQPPQQCRRHSEPVLSTAFKSRLLTAGGWGARVILCTAVLVQGLMPNLATHPILNMCSYVNWTSIKLFCKNSFS